MPSTSLREYFPGQAVSFVVGVSADKDAAGIFQALLPPADPRIQTAATLLEALRLALTEPRTPIVCVAGSLFLIGQVLAQAPEKQDILCGVRAR